MLVSTKSEADFSVGCALPVIAYRFLATPSPKCGNRSPTEGTPARQGCEVLVHKLINVVVVAVVYAVDVP
jgi:hypothetical protein